MVEVNGSGMCKSVHCCTWRMLALEALPEVPLAPQATSHCVYRSPKIDLGEKASSLIKLTSYLTLCQPLSLLAFASHFLFFIDVKK